ncbi:hypothetical protein AMTR_s00030p00219840 [Amborella trichopoda]|uniref:Uncharacterized protein n=1 Tax=Amborella trichopoda TaxID=13333 RepID=U5D414_AMBTC|nr:hypothetical protein AMTR_s00030p00219840 [Amborella trichopoda]
MKGDITGLISLVQVGVGMGMGVGVGGGGLALMETGGLNPTRTLGAVGRNGRAPSDGDRSGKLDQALGGAPGGLGHSEPALGRPGRIEAGSECERNQSGQVGREGTAENSRARR